MLSKIALGVLAPSLLVATSTADTFNIDIYATPSPPPTYGGLAGPAGTWNTLPIGVLTPLVTVQNAPDDSSALVSGFPLINAEVIPAPHTELFQDMSAAGFTPEQFQVTNLAAGNYAMVLYSHYPDITTDFTLTPTGGAVQTSTVACDSLFPGLVPGKSLTQFQFSIPAGGGGVTVDFVGNPVGGNEGGVLNGVQLVKVVGQIGCPQPINSVFAFPSIVATGTTDPTGTGFLVSANDIQLSVGLLPASNTAGIGAILCFVANVGGTTFPESCNGQSPGVGQRCIGNPTVFRVFDPAGAGSGGVGQTSAAGTYNLPIDLTALGLLGVNVNPGDTLHFQMMYRDNSNGDCPNSTSVRRWTQSLEIQLF